MAGRFFLGILAAICVATMAGPLPAQDARPAADSPEAASQKFLGALSQRDRKAYDEVVAQGDLVGPMFAYAEAADAFKAKMIEAYGEAGWRNFQDPSGARIVLAYIDPDWNDAKFTVEGDKATAKLAGAGEELHLVRQKGAWRVDLDSGFLAGAQGTDMKPEALGKALAKMTKIVRDYQAKIGDSTTVDEIDQAMGQEFFKVILSVWDKPAVRVEPKPDKK